ncbi:polysaccharide biosynthesis C-terminal domain-containing protein [Rhizobium sp. KVB221]|uniref:Polysaccharide biosynthesis C-terminal domain-containing protein n=1 Tax=Rhizobium setariae TaxID=2801340 RepID=A0A936YHW5_9HYPH|nr:polysaccharide biosynthesis C-terminal domain-containing protein [Rhizobium setariae]MBL0370529.1 polysaccharide biosynthesis C-terminal domain-containing protein [Rhizobium setariae]
MANGIVANSIVNALAGFMLLVTGFASAIITARLLGPEANGIIAFSLWLVVSGASIAELGSSVLLLKMLPQLKAQGYDEHRRKGFAAILIIPTVFATVVLVALYGVFFLTSEQLHWAETAPSVALVTGILFVMQAIGSFSKFYLIGEKRLGSFFKLTMLVSLVQMAGVLFGAIYYGVEGALVGYAFGQLVLFIATLPIILTRRDWCDVPKNYLTSSSIIISLEFIVDSIFLNRLELLFLQQFWSVKMVGFYAVGLSIANMALQVPIQLTGSLLPYYSERRHESGGGGLSADVIGGVVRSLSYITLPMSLGLAAISEELVVTVFGEPFRDAGMMVALLALAAPGAAFMQTLSLYLLSQDRAKERLWIGVIAGAIMVVGCLALVPQFGGEGAAATRIAVFVAMCVMMIKLLKFGSEFNKLYVTLLKVALASAGCGMAALGVLSLQGGPIGLLLAIVAGAVVYVPALKLFRAVPEEDADLIRQSARKLPGRLRGFGEAIANFVCPPTVEAVATVSPAIPSAISTEGAGRQAALPVVFAGTLGHFMPEDMEVEKRDVAVLLLSPWGYDEMCLRKSYRVLAERFAAAGIASLRFDFPGTGDSIDATDFGAGIAVWEEAALDAARQLKALSHCDRLVVIGQGIGATIGYRIAERIGGVEALGLLAPVANGRTYLREVSFRAKFIYEDLGLSDADREVEGVSIAGLRMPDEIAEDVRKIKLGGDEKVAIKHALIVERGLKMADTTLLDALAANGATVEQIEYAGYDELMTMPLTAREPVEVMNRLVDWVSALATPGTRPAASERPDSGFLEGEGFREQPVRFGVHKNLVGVVCLPADGPSTGASVLLLTTAYDRHSGWGGSMVAMARQLARHGIASMRYDSSNIADSPPRPDAPDRVLYSETQNEDAVAALDVLEAHKPGPLMVAGRCSGGYVAFRTGLVDRRLSAIVTVNPFVFYWNPDEKVPEDISVVPRSLEDYGNRFARVETLKRLFKGEINIRAALRNMIVAMSRRISFRIAPLLMHLPGRSTVAREVKRSFAHYHQKSIPVTVMYSERDVGLEHLYFHFGANGRRISRYENVELIMMPQTDHNLTPARARRRLFDEIFKLAKRA